MEAIARWWPLGLFFIILAIISGAIRRQHNAGRRAINEVWVSGHKRGGCIRRLANLFLIIASTVLLIWVLGETGIGYFLTAGLAATFYDLVGSPAHAIDNPFHITLAIVGIIALSLVIAQSAIDARDANR